MSDLHDNYHKITCEHNDNKIHMQSLRFPCGDCSCGNLANCRCNEKHYFEDYHNHKPAHADECTKGCDKKKEGRCGCKRTKTSFPGNMIVIDDANETTFFYGNVVHENYHKPENVCSPFVAVPTNMLTYTGNDYPQGHEIFDGIASQNSITLKNTPDKTWPVFVFKNGLKQIEGDERDITISGNEIQFKFYELQPTDVVEVYYRYFNKED